METTISRKEKTKLTPGAAAFQHMLNARWTGSRKEKTKLTAGAAGLAGRAAVTIGLLALLGTAFVPAAPAAGPMTIGGRLTVRVTDDPDAGRARYSYGLTLASGKVIKLRPASGRISAAPGSRLRVTGTPIDGALPVRSLKVQRAGDDARSPEPVSGERRVAVILLNFLNDQSQPWSPAYARAIVFDPNETSANAYFREVSSYRENPPRGLSLRGKQSPDGSEDVFGWYTVPHRSDVDCDPQSWTDAARNMVTQEHGPDALDGYDHLIFAWPRTPACGWMGQGDLHGTEARINGQLYWPVISHELGHNLGLQHASAYRCHDEGGQPVAYGPHCTAIEYGDPFDLMGRSPTHLHSYHKAILGFFPPARTITGSGTYTILPGEQVLSGDQGLEIPLPRRPGEPFTRYSYYLGFRQPYGWFDRFSASDPVVNGVTVRLVSEYINEGIFEARSYLLDTVPCTESRYDAPLLAGRVFTDPEAGVSVRTVAVSPAAATVEVALGPTSPAPAYGCEAPPPAPPPEPAPQPAGLPPQTKAAKLRIKLLYPRPGSRIARRRLRVIRGKLTGAKKVKRVYIALRRRRGKRCFWLARRGLRRRTCRSPRYLRARGKRRWRYRLNRRQRRSLRAGGYLVRIRVKGKNGHLLTTSGDVKSRFRIRKRRRR